MVSRSMRPFAAAVVLILAGLVGAGAQPAAPAPAPDPGTGAQPNCIVETGSYRQKGKSFEYEIALENKCERRLRCEVFAYVVQAKGPSSGRATLVLEPKSHGAGAKRTYAMTVKMVGGITQTTRECRAL